MFTWYCFSNTFSYTEKHNWQTAGERESHRKVKIQKQRIRQWFFSIASYGYFWILVDFANLRISVIFICRWITFTERQESQNVISIANLTNKTAFVTNLTNKLPSEFQLPTQFGLDIHFPLILLFWPMFVPSSVQTHKNYNWTREKQRSKVTNKTNLQKITPFTNLQNYRSFLTSFTGHFSHILCGSIRLEEKNCRDGGGCARLRCFPLSNKNKIRFANWLNILNMFIVSDYQWFATFILLLLLLVVVVWLCAPESPRTSSYECL